MIESLCRSKQCIWNSSTQRHCPCTCPITTVTPLHSQLQLLHVYTGPAVELSVLAGVTDKHAMGQQGSAFGARLIPLPCPCSMPALPPSPPHIHPNPPLGHSVAVAAQHMSSRKLGQAGSMALLPFLQQVVKEKAARQCYLPGPASCSATCCRWCRHQSFFAAAKGAVSGHTMSLLLSSLIGCTFSHSMW